MSALCVDPPYNVYGSRFITYLAVPTELQTRIAKQKHPPTHSKTKQYHTNTLVARCNSVGCQHGGLMLSICLCCMWVDYYMGVIIPPSQWTKPNADPHNLHTYISTPKNTWPPARTPLQFQHYHLFTGRLRYNHVSETSDRRMDWMIN